MDADSRIAALEAEIQRLSAPRGRSQKYERDTYYRRPNNGEDSGWIVTGPTLSGTSARDFAARGFLSLEAKYGTIPHGETNKWKKILTHPDGPSEFPADQVLSLRWYKEPPVPGVKFPQIQGQKITEYKCPNCSRRFPSFKGRNGIQDLAQHMVIIERYDRAGLQRYGDTVGIDFTAVDTAIEEIVTEYGDDTPSCDECGWKPDPEKQNPDAAVRLHKMKAHAEPEVETVG